MMSLIGRKESGRFELEEKYWLEKRFFDSSADFHLYLIFSYLLIFSSFEVETVISNKRLEAVVLYKLPTSQIYTFVLAFC